MESKSPCWMLGNKQAPHVREFSDKVAWKDHKIRFAASYCRGKEVLDLGCVHHNPENYRSKYWLHKALVAVASQVHGMDLYEEGVAYLRSKGYQVFPGNAECFDLGRKYDVIVAGDLIEHVTDLRGFLTSCRRHLRLGGKLLISTPNPWYWRNVAKAFFLGAVGVNVEHTLWLCPATLTQLVARCQMKVECWHYGSRYLKDRIVPLPKAVKHAGFHAVVSRAE